jgi:light-harvesting protein B-800-850 alpha chain
LIDGKCVPIEQQAPAAEEPAAPVEEPAAPAEEPAAPAEEAAPTDQAPADEAPLKCPEGQVLVEGKCIPIEQAPASAQ